MPLSNWGPPGRTIVPCSKDGVHSGFPCPRGGGAALSGFVPALLLLIAWEVAFLWAAGWLMGRFGGRRTWVLWAAVALELLEVVVSVVIDVADSGRLDLLGLLPQNAAGPLPVVVLLLPPSWRWFSQRKRTDAPS